MKTCSIKFRKIRLKETAKKRYQLICLCLIFIFSISIWCTPFSAVQGENEYITKEYIVEEGDTLWSIAECIKNPNVDTREVVYDIMQCNELSDTMLVVGESINLPVYN